MFPDSAIAQGYEQSDTKVQCVIKYGIGEHIKEGLINDAATTPYSFLFDETTNSQVKKQYNAYLIYWSKKSGIVEHSVNHSRNGLIIWHTSSVLTKIKLV